jgi:acyl carrier protein
MLACTVAKAGGDFTITNSVPPYSGQPGAAFKWNRGSKEFSMSIAEIKLKLDTFLSTHLRNKELTCDQDIFALGLVNSLFAMQLVTFVEKEFGITVEQEDLEIENFSTINAIANLVCRKIGSAMSA